MLKHSCLAYEVDNLRNKLAKKRQSRNMPINSRIACAFIRIFLKLSFAFEHIRKVDGHLAFAGRNASVATPLRTIKLPTEGPGVWVCAHEAALAHGKTRNTRGHWREPHAEFSQKSAIYLTLTFLKLKCRVFLN